MLDDVVELERERDGMDEYTACDQCYRGCSVEALRCDAGRARYREVTGKEYVSTGKVEEEDGSAYRRMIRERRARKKQ